MAISQFYKKKFLFFRDVLIGATDEVLCELKNEKTKDKVCKIIFKNDEIEMIIFNDTVASHGVRP